MPESYSVPPQPDPVTVTNQKRTGCHAQYDDNNHERGLIRRQDAMHLADCQWYDFVKFLPDVTKNATFE